MEYYPIILWLVFLSAITFIFGIEMVLKKDKSITYRFIFRRRSIHEFSRKVGPKISVYIPKAKTIELENKLMYANYPYNFTLESFIGFQFVLSMIALMGGLILTTLGMPSFLMIALIAIAFFAPVAILNEKVKKRQTAIRSELPAMAGLLATSVKAGVELGPAFEMLSNTLPGELGDELRKTMKKIATGTQRSQAFRDMGRRAGVDILDRFIDTINTVEERGGMNISLMLNEFVKDVRKMHRLDIQEKINNLQVKMLLPIATCIFIPMLIILMTPVTLTLSKSL
ncbi:type II secretion system F family protein [Wukongibacter baidiensis]